MKFIVLGRSASGKDALANRLGKYGLKILKTYTDRPCRGPSDENAHVFVRPEDVDSYNDRCLEACFGGHRYFARKADIETADVLILEPSGMTEVCSLYPDEIFYVLNVIPADPAEADAKYLARFQDLSEDRLESERLRLADRRKEEDSLFGPLEAALRDKTASDLVPQNVGRSYVLENKYDPSEMDGAAKAFAAMKRQFDNTVVIAAQMAAVGIFYVEPDGNRPVLRMGDGPAAVDRPVSLDMLAMTLLNNDALFCDTVRQWLGCEFPSFPVPTEVKYHLQKALSDRD